MANIAEVLFQEVAVIQYAENGDSEKINGIRVSGCDDGDYIEDRRELWCRMDKDEMTANRLPDGAHAWYGVEWTEWRGDTVNRYPTLQLVPILRCWIVSFGH